MSSRMDDIVKRIEECGYDADKFTLSLSLPISLAIRFLFHPSIYIKIINISICLISSFIHELVHRLTAK